MTYRRILLALLALGLLACAFVGVRRWHHEREARGVELVMDDGDFQSLARSYGYDQRAFLVALRRAGLTSLAVSEELGGAVGQSGNAAAYAGSQLIAQSRLGPIGDPTLGGLARAGRLRADEVYLIAYDAPTAARYARQLALKFPHGARVLHRGLPTVWALRTQSDYFAQVGLGLPPDRVALARTLGLRLVPRLQNDERLDDARIDALVASALPPGARADVAIFFGQRNQVLGYPDHVDASAQALRAHRLSFGTIEVYDQKQLQAGNDELARRLPDRTVRVEAIAKTELDKLRPQEIVQRYLLGARERNVRVVYLRPFAHQWDGRSIEATNVELVRQIRDGLRRDGLHAGGATPFQRFVIRPVEIVVASLAVPAALLLLLAAFGIGNVRLAAVVVGLDLLLVVAGVAVHRDLLVRKALALLGGITFATGGFVAVAPLFAATRPRGTGAALGQGLRALALAVGIALGGALVVIGLLSTPLTMTEVERFSGVKLLLAVPPVVALALYFLTPRFGARVAPARLADAPVRVWWLLAVAVAGAAAYLVLIRSGNQSDIAPSSFELALRAHLTSLLSVRPRTKEFLAGFPALVLLPALLPVDRRRFGWLLALAIGIGLGDVVDTFSHLHTPLAVSALRLINGVVLGALVGALAVVVYRRARPGARPASTAVDAA